MIIFFIFLAIITGYILKISPFLGLFFLASLSVLCWKKTEDVNLLLAILIISSVSMVFGVDQDTSSYVEDVDEILIIDYKYYRDEIHYIVESKGNIYELFVEEDNLYSIGTYCTGMFEVAEVKEQRNFLKHNEGLRLTVNDIGGRIYLSSLREYECMATDFDFGMFLSNIRFIYMSHILEYTEFDYKYDLLTLTVGNKSYIENDFFDSLQKLGIYHLYVISGTHVAFISGVLYFTFRKMRMTSRTIKVLLIFSLIIFYMMNIFSPSVFRAVFMAVLLIVTSFFKKKPYLSIISLSAIIQIIFNPYIVFHAGFQLSYVTTYFILLSRHFIHGRSPFIQLLQITLIAEVSTLMIILVQFNEISISGIVMNLIFVPLFSCVVFPMVILFQLFMMLPYIPVVDYMYHYIFTLFQTVIEYLANVITHRFSIKNLNSFIYILISVLTYLIAKYICVLNLKKAILCSAVFIAVVYTFNNVAREDFTFTMIDVGQGDAFLIEDHTNNTSVLIDTGGEFTFGDRESMLAERTVLPYLKERGIDDIDLLVLSHLDIDHVGEAGDIINKKNVRNILLNPDDPKAESWSEDFASTGFTGKVLSAEKVKYMNIGDIHIKNLTLKSNSSSQDSNESSIVLKITLGAYEFLMTGDMTEAMEDSLAAREDIKVDVLKLAHHGSNTSTGNRMVTSAQPVYGLVSAGADNRYGHPHSEVLERLGGVNILNTAEAGMVQLNIRGQELCIVTKLKATLNRCTKKELTHQLSE